MQGHVLTFIVRRPLSELLRNQRHLTEFLVRISFYIYLRENSGHDVLEEGDGQPIDTLLIECNDVYVLCSQCPSFTSVQHTDKHSATLCHTKYSINYCM